MATDDELGDVCTFGSVPLVRSSAEFCSGAAFELRDPPRNSGTVDLGSWRIDFRAGESFVVARGGNEQHYVDAYRAALVNAQRALDLRSAEGADDLAIKAFDDDHIVWWSDQGQPVIRIVSTATLKFYGRPAKLTVFDRDGEEVPAPPRPRVDWHESFRYFRLSQITDDLFDAYRNAYLALEAILSDIAPQRLKASGRVDEGEGQWFKRALGEAGRLVALSDFAQGQPQDAVTSLHQDFFRDMRSGMSHAKSGRTVLLPQDESERRTVTESLDRLVRLYLALVEAHLGSRRLGGFLTAYAFKEAHVSTFDRMEACVSDDDTPFSKQETAPNPSGGAMVAIPGSEPARELEPFSVARLWKADLQHFSELPFIRRVIAMLDGQAGFVAVLEGRLALRGSGRLEVMLASRGVNASRPRLRFSY